MWDQHRSTPPHRQVSGALAALLTRAGAPGVHGVSVPAVLHQPERDGSARPTRRAAAGPLAQLGAAQGAPQPASTRLCTVAGRRCTTARLANATSRTRVRRHRSARTTKSIMFTHQLVRRRVQHSPRRARLCTVAGRRCRDGARRRARPTPHRGRERGQHARHARRGSDGRRAAHAPLTRQLAHAACMHDFTKVHPSAERAKVTRVLGVAPVGH